LIGVLAALAAPAYQRLVSHSRNLLFQNELRVAAQALETYAMEKGDWPPDGGGGWPPPVMDYLPPPARWHLPTPVGGHWGWARGVDGAEAALQISGYTGGLARGLALDRRIDDGDLTAGIFRGTSDKLLYILQE
jgi:Type II secretory pathway, pseudopilin PulG